MMEEDNIEATYVDIAEEKNSSEEVNFGLGDLVSVKNMIDVASRRGAFSAAEFSSIGEVYNRLSAFLEKHVKSEENEEEVEEKE